ncbi:8-amino-7-oxononanoate synthase [Bacillus cereus group sp. TH43LC]|uniref:8-amino-7-oxononanoate synthase n=1 Tax=Bacillus cereus group TaxID=86661 RepID=UPI00187A7347|nr:MULTISPECIES: 8-amino-7-oxononanoate synthase [Bacillus cereus group]MBE7142864.1 8-amino-7-oxononanoate synthase [Bacillus paranthracis]MDA1503702.1 8-amino-7-oxononanoate synthase [Bacillus cereus group sp. TH43LC]MDA1790522.1 8-amino-7-oxononanoate synthase [Bacillus cereus group sp. BY5-1LC]MDA1861465.1 8-amino-7-oxononanoate synthase [Bacillus cereus group sp. BY128LC]UTG84876.1 8-amino-7-oxononanoate synthase [Bacillus paranthracis]
MNQTWRTHLQSKLQQLHEREQYRNLHVTEQAEETWLIRDEKRMLNLASNNYLGLAGDERLKEAAIACTRKYGTGATASRLVVGNYSLYEEVERSICDWKGTEKALVVNSGYTANIGVISSLVSRHDIVFSDKLNHASIVDGIILSGAEHKRYGHNDLDHLEKLLKTASPEKRKLIVTDTVFSMDGDTAYLRELVELKEKYGAILIVDEAHASGIYGIGGAGLSHIEDLAQKIDIHMGTFSKALGCYGAYLTGDAIYIEYLHNMMRSFIFTTALPAGTLGAVQKAIEIVQEDHKRRENLIANGEYFRSKLRDAGFNIGNSSTHIVPIVVGSNENALRFSKRLQEAGIAAIAIRPPTVPINSSRIRFAVTSQHTIADLKWAIDRIIHIAKEEELFV